jgi:hypothetical protein
MKIDRSELELHGGGWRRKQNAVKLTLILPPQFQFREGHGPQITSKGQTLDAQDKRDAANKHKRQKAYTSQIQDGIGKGDNLEAAMNGSLRNLMAKFKSMLDCERCGLFFLDEETDELYFHVEEEGQHIR